MLLIFFLWIKIISLTIPIIFTGIFLVRRFSTLNRLELIFPAGVGIGFSLFIFILNFFFHFFKGEGGILLAYSVILILFFILIFKFRNKLFEPINKKFFLLWILSIIVWGSFLIWKLDHPLIGGDTRVYYPIASSFIKGNYPPVTPWQPDVPLSYHLGTFELLGALQFLSNFSYDFLHLYLAFLFIFSAIQIVIWITGRHTEITSFLLANLAAIVGFICFGFFKVALPRIPVHIPIVHTLNEFIIWMRSFPKAEGSMETYGVVTSVDSLLYVIFHATGLIVFLSLLVFVLFMNKRNFLGWLIFLMALSSLALIDESIFTATFPAFFLALFFQIKKVKIVLIFLVISIFIALQGGVISNSLLPPKGADRSVVLFPRIDDISGDFVGHQINSIRSKLFVTDEKLGSFVWFNVGADLSLALALILILQVKVDSRNKLLFAIFFMGALFALVTYLIVIPKYIISNSNRILGLTFWFSGILIAWSLIPIMDAIKQKKSFIKFSFYTTIILISIPTVLPPLTSLSLTRFGEDRLIPKEVNLSPTEMWMKNNLKFEDRTLILDGHTPHPSGIIASMTNTGISSPVFAGGFRTYTVEPGPEFTDVAYSLSPEALKKLKISYLVINQEFFERLPDIRKDQLKDSEYFSIVFNNSLKDGWVKIYKVSPPFLDVGEISGTLSELDRIAPMDGNYFIDNEKNFTLDYLRRPVIFTLRKRNLHFEAGSGVYQHVETPINFSGLDKNNNYNYFVLSKKITPKDICNCSYKVMWSGLNNEVYLYKKT